MTTGCGAEIYCAFDEAMWRPDLLQTSNCSPPDLPVNWRSLLSVPPPPITSQSAECGYLVSLMAERTADKVAEIRGQALNVFLANQGIQDVVGVLSEEDTPLTVKALRLLFDNADAPIYYFKHMFRRGRPAMCCDDIKPLFTEADGDYYPKHPAYPSGHSTKAHAVAYFYARLFPALTDDLFRAAAAVARNREVAGLHYPSDSLAGKLLAGQLVDALFTNAKFQTAAALARAEWP